MTNLSLAQSYVTKATVRMKALAVLRDEGAHSDVVRKAQEIVELALKGTLRAIGVEPPKFHDVGGLLLEHSGKLPAAVAGQLPRAAGISKRLRRERELSFYGDIDFIPTEEYSDEDARRAFEEASWIVELATEVIGKP